MKISGVLILVVAVLLMVSPISSAVPERPVIAMEPATVVAIESYPTATDIPSGIPAATVNKVPPLTQASPAPELRAPDEVIIYSKEEAKGTGIAKVTVWRFEDAMYLDIESVFECINDMRFHTWDISVCDPDKEWGRYSGGYCDWYGTYHHVECSGRGCTGCRPPGLYYRRSW